MPGFTRIIHLYQLLLLRKIQNRSFTGIRSLRNTNNLRPKKILRIAKKCEANSCERIAGTGMTSDANVEELSVRGPVDGEAKMAEARGAVMVAECMDAAKNL